MPLNTTDQERQKAANTDLALKLQLEARYERELRELFAVMSRDLEASVLQTAEAQDANNYLTDLNGLISRHYRRVNEKFSGRIFDFIDSNIDNDDEPLIGVLAAVALLRNISLKQLVDQMKAEGTLASQNFIQTNAQQDARFITATNQRQLDSSVALATSVLFANLGREPTNEEISKLSRRQFASKTPGRIQNIATTGTQKIAEGTKDIEREIFILNRNNLSGLVNNIKPLQFEELWITMGDDIVRPSHVEADGQKKNERGVFIVQNQELEFPGDTSRGATLDNTAGCRCSAVGVIDEGRDIALSDFTVSVIGPILN